MFILLKLESLVQLNCIQLVIICQDSFLHVIILTPDRLVCGRFLF